MNELNEILKRLARIEEKLNEGDTKSFRKDWYTVPEAAKLLDRKKFTVREWCRLGRLQARKRKCGRGRTSEWIIAASEIERYLNDGLLPDRGSDPVRDENHDQD